MGNAIDKAQSVLSTVNAVVTTASSILNVLKPVVGSVTAVRDDTIVDLLYDISVSRNLAEALKGVVSSATRNPDIKDQQLAVYYTVLQMMANCLSYMDSSIKKDSKGNPVMPSKTDLFFDYHEMHTSARFVLMNLLTVNKDLGIAIPTSFLSGAGMLTLPTIEAQFGNSTAYDNTKWLQDPNKLSVYRNVCPDNESVKTVFKLVDVTSLRRTSTSPKSDRKISPEVKSRPGRVSLAETNPLTVEVPETAMISIFKTSEAANECYPLILIGLKGQSGYQTTMEHRIGDQGVAWSFEGYDNTYVHFTFHQGQAYTYNLKIPWGKKDYSYFLWSGGGNEFRLDYTILPEERVIHPKVNSPLRSRL